MFSPVWAADGKKKAGNSKANESPFEDQARAKTWSADAAQPYEELKSYEELNDLAAAATDGTRAESRYFEDMASRYSWALLRLKDALTLARHGSSKLRDLATAIETDEANYAKLVHAVYHLQDLARQRAFARRVQAATLIQRAFRMHRTHRPELLRKRFRDFRLAASELQRASRLVETRRRWLALLWLAALGILLSCGCILIALHQKRDMARIATATLDAFDRLSKESTDQATALEVQLGVALERADDAEAQLDALRAELNATRFAFETLLHNVARVERAWPLFSILSGLDAERLLVLRQQCAHSSDSSCGQIPLLDEDLTRRRIKPRQHFNRRQPA